MHGRRRPRGESTRELTDMMFVYQASYLRPISSSAMVTFWPFGVAIEYSWRGWVPTSSSFTVRAPDVGWLSCMYVFDSKYRE